MLAASTHVHGASPVTGLSERRLKGWLCAQRTYGNTQGLKWMVYWRLFYLACSELFCYNSGEEWYVSHYLFKKR